MDQLVIQSSTYLSLQVHNSHVRNGAKVCVGVNDGDVGGVLIGFNVESNKLRIAQPGTDVHVTVVQVGDALRDRRLA